MPTQSWCSSIHTDNDTAHNIVLLKSHVRFTIPHPALMLTDQPRS